MQEESIEAITERLSKSLILGQSMTPNTSSSELSQAQKEDIRRLVSDFLKPDIPEEEGDQPIGIIRVEELDKIPDVVKSIREFSGRAGEFSSWRKSVERVLALFESIKGSGRYFAILHTIRTKIVGEADTALDSYRTPLDWVRIRKCLMMHYSDKRGIGTLEYQMTTMFQDNRTITEFYQAVYQHFSLILDKIACLELDESSILSMTSAYRDRALDTFVRGLKGDLPRLLSVR